MEEPAAAWAPCEFQLANWAVEEPAAAWAPCEFQLANWAVEEPAAAGAGLPVEYYYYSAASTHSVTSGNAGESSVQVSPAGEVNKISNDDNRSRCVVEQVVSDFKADIDMMKVKMHRYPACLGAVDKCYTVPRLVAIGPYHHGVDDLKKAEEVKHAAACHCAMRSGSSLEELYFAVVSTADDARRLYDKDVMAGIGCDDFWHMMFFDACFLVQYMLMRGGTEIDESLHGFMSPNRIDIFHDVMLLENQLPWELVETVMRFIIMPVSVSAVSKNFVANTKHCMLPDVLHEPPQQMPLIWYEDYKPPHLLGLLRYYIVGRSDTNDHHSLVGKYMSFSASAMELAEIGITLTANKTMELVDMRLINHVWTLCPELSLLPLSLDRDSASYLVNMAALELCTLKSFSDVKPRNSAVCSYLLLLAMLVCRKEDVHELRVRGLLLGGGGLTNTEALRFFTSFQGLRIGPYYYYLMVQIQNYRDRSRMKTWFFAFIHNHKKSIAMVVSGIGVAATIIGTLVGMLGKLKTLNAAS